MPEVTKGPDTHDPSVSRVAAILGIICDSIFVLNVFARLSFGGKTGFLSPTAYGLLLLQAGFSRETARALDMGNPSLVMVLALLGALAAGIMGLIGLFLRGRKRKAVTAILTGFGLWAAIILLAVLASLI
jgi:hypothetical protein